MGLKFGDIRRGRRRGITLLEIVLVIALLVLLTALVVPNLIQDIEQERLPQSGFRLRSLLTMARAKAMANGVRYRVRFPDPADEKNADPELARQPVVEWEKDPLAEPGVFEPVTEPWANGEIVLRGVRCVKVKLGRPSYEDTFEDVLTKTESQDVETATTFTAEKFPEDLPPLVLEPDGASDWSLWILCEAEMDVRAQDMADVPKVQVLLDGQTGLAWVQRPLYKDEMEILAEVGMPPVLRFDRVTNQRLTEDQVLEVKEKSFGRK